MSRAGTGAFQMLVGWVDTSCPDNDIGCSIKLQRAKRRGEAAVDFVLLGRDMNEY